MRGHTFKPGERVTLTTREGNWRIIEVDEMLLTAVRDGEASEDGKGQIWITEGQVRELV